MVDLAELLDEQGDGEEVEYWYRCAADLGDAYAMDQLCWLLQQQGQVREATQWYRRAAEKRESDAAWA